MKHPLIRSVPLGNGLVLNLYDTSKVGAGDRCYVALSAVIDIPVASARSGADGAPADLTEILGESVRFEQTRERHFIDVRDKTAVLDTMVKDLLDASAGYLGHPDFPRKTVLREYAKRRGPGFRRR